MWLARNADFRFPFENMHERIKRNRVFTQSLSFVEREDGHTTSWLLDNFGGDNRAILVVQQLNGLRDFATGDRNALSRRIVHRNNKKNMLANLAIPMGCLPRPKDCGIAICFAHEETNFDV